MKFGYYSRGRDINLIVDPLLRLLDGRNDLPCFEDSMESGMNNCLSMESIRLGSPAHRIVTKTQNSARGWLGG